MSHQDNKIGTITLLAFGLHQQTNFFKRNEICWTNSYSTYSTSLSCQSRYHRYFPSYYLQFSSTSWLRKTNDDGTIIVQLFRKTRFINLLTSNYLTIRQYWSSCYIFSTINGLFFFENYRYARDQAFLLLVT